MTDVVASPTAGNRRRAALVILVAGALVGAAALLVASRGPRTDGPLSNGDAGVVVYAFPADATVAYGLQTLGNDDLTDDLELISVDVRVGDPPVEILGQPQLLGPERVAVMDAGAFDVVRGWPPYDIVPVPVEGAVVPAGARAQFEVLVPLSVPDEEQGIGIIDGFVVEYEAGGRRYREETEMVLVICPIQSHVACDDFDPGTDL